MRSMTQLLQVASHELRGPLSAVKGYASTLIDYYDKLDEDEVQQYIRGIDGAAHRLEILVSDLLFYSLLESGASHLNLTEVPLGAFLRRAMESRRIVAPAHQYRLSVSSPDPRVKVDTVRLVQVVDNLLDNAIRYGAPPFTISVSIQDHSVVVSFRDRGPGVPEASLEEIFEPFVRVQTGQMQLPKGTGLGLSVCKGIVEEHGGTIWAERPRGGGFRVIFALPLKQPRRTRQT